jgi:molecular chaperone HscB
VAEAALNTGRTSKLLCPHCGAETSDAHFCGECGKIQPLSSRVDHFRFFDLPRKLRIDPAELEKRFYSHSRQFHPDYFLAAGDLEKQASVERSSKLNDAYRTLRDSVGRITYLLTLEGYKESEKKAPPDLLEEVFELNMNIEEIKSAKKTGDVEEVAEARLSLEEALQDLNEKLGEIDGRLARVSDEWDNAVDLSADQNERKLFLDQMSELLSHRSYIRHLVGVIQEEL